MSHRSMQVFGFSGLAINSASLFGADPAATVHAGGIGVCTIEGSWDHALDGLNDWREGVA